MVYTYIIGRNASINKIAEIQWYVYHSSDANIPGIDEGSSRDVAIIYEGTEAVS